MKPTEMRVATIAVIAIILAVSGAKAEQPACTKALGDEVKASIKALEEARQNIRGLTTAGHEDFEQRWESQFNWDKDACAGGKFYVVDGQSKAQQTGLIYIRCGIVAQQCAFDAVKGMKPPPTESSSACLAAKTDCRNRYVSTLTNIPSVAPESPKGQIVFGPPAPQPKGSDVSGLDTRKPPPTLPDSTPNPNKPIKPPPSPDPPGAGEKTIKEILVDPQGKGDPNRPSDVTGLKKDPDPTAGGGQGGGNQAAGNQPGGNQPGGGGAPPAPATQQPGGVKLDVRSRGQTEDLSRDRDDVLKLGRKPGM